LQKLESRLAELREKNPHAYPRDYAAMLGISEADLTPEFYGDRVIDLYNIEAVLQSLANLPRIKLMARTGFAVFELFTKINLYRQAGALILQSDVCYVALNTFELGKIFFLSPAAEKEKAAVLIFDKAGTAALKLYFEAHEFDVSLLKSAPMLCERADIPSLLLAARPKDAVRSSVSPRALIEKAAAEKAKVGFELLTEAIVVFMQHAPVKVVDARGWFNILDEDFNLHLKEAEIIGDSVKFYGDLK